MTSQAEDLYLERILSLTRLGQSLADVHCYDGRLAVALAQAGRRVWTFETSREAQETICRQSQEVRDRLKISSRACDVESTRQPFDLAYIKDHLYNVERPAELFSTLRIICAPGSAIVICCPNGPRYTPPDALWTFNAETITFVLQPFGEPTVQHSKDQTALVVVLRPRRFTPPGPVRLMLIFRLASDDRWLKDSLASVTDIVGAIIAIDDNVTSRGFSLVRDHEKVIYSRRRTPLPLDDSSMWVAAELAQAWFPDWILKITSTEVLGFGAAAQMMQAIRSAELDLHSLTLETRAFWNAASVVRVDSPTRYVRQERVVRWPSISDGKRLDLAAVVNDYGYMDPALRTARKTTLILTGDTARSDWTLDDPAQLAAVSDARAAAPVEAALHTSLSRVEARVRRVLCLDPNGMDVARVVALAWPLAAVTAISAASTLKDPHAVDYHVAFRGRILDLDLALLFGQVPFDAVIDGDLVSDPDHLVDRLRRIRSLLTDGGTLTALIGGGNSDQWLKTTLKRRAFFSSDFTITRIHQRVDQQDGGNLRIVEAMVRPPAHEAAKAMTVVVPIVGERDAAWLECTYESMRILTEWHNVDLVIARQWMAQEENETLGRYRHFLEVYESGIAATVAAAFDAFPARSMCIFQAGTTVEGDWCAALLAALRDRGLGIVALGGSATYADKNVVDSPVLAVSIDAVNPLAWPDFFADDRIRAGVLAGIAARNRRGVRLIRSIIATGHQRILLPQSLAASEAQRADFLGVPGGARRLLDRSGVTQAPDTK